MELELELILIKMSFEFIKTLNVKHFMFKRNLRKWLKKGCFRRFFMKINVYPEVYQLFKKVLSFNLARSFHS
ncbi:hypothetical protein DIT68_02465 [Brumimicrobium oceani]|uniref:Uncharacterized protein n=1 Tax=Brumimicrobium oceani TaxID=2100725 RepID=A0A2U2XH80_9FLAO|nr:hypothetical protein DIT68_02465 [Brumimicrobium oceani]